MSKPEEATVPKEPSEENSEEITSRRLVKKSAKEESMPLIMHHRSYKNLKLTPCITNHLMQKALRRTEVKKYQE